MSSSRKKVIVRQWSQEWLPGYLPPSDFQNSGHIELLDLGGKVQRLDSAGVKWICFVRDFNSGEIANPERLIRKTFGGRPRSTGLWIRLKLTDEDILEGIADNDSTLITSQGIFLTPPDTRSNTQRLFLPPSSIATLVVMGLIGAPAKTKAGRPGIGDEQPQLFNS